MKGREEKEEYRKDGNEGGMLTLFECIIISEREEKILAFYADNLFIN